MEEENREYVDKLKKAGDIKKSLLEALDRWDSFYGAGSTDELRKTVNNANDYSTLFRMQQIFREKLELEDTSFKVKLKDGTIKQFKNLQEADLFFKGDHK